MKQIEIKLTCFLVFAVFIAFFSFASAAEVVVIVNKKNPVVRIPKKDLAGIYRLRMLTWRNGNPIEPINLEPKNMARQIFSQSILGRSAEKADQFYLTQALAGKGLPPKVLKTEKAVLEAVRENVNAVAYISRDNLDDSVVAVQLNGGKEIHAPETEKSVNN